MNVVHTILLFATGNPTLHYPSVTRGYSKTEGYTESPTVRG